MQNERIGERKVFGIGLSRTGTKSLTAALNMLGVKTKWYPQDWDTYCDLLMGQYQLRVLQEYQGLTDTPVAPYYAQFDKEYPGSRFILTVREKEAWLRSCAKHWANSGIYGPVPDSAPFSSKFAQFVDCCVYGSHQFNPDRWSFVYDTHVENVKRYFRDRPNDLLVIDIPGGEGWEKLCPFLGLEPIDEPFPTVNAFRSPLLG